MKIIFISLTLLLCGCSNLLNSTTKKTEIQKTRHDASKATAQGSVDITYPQAASYNVTASGNAVVSLAADAGGMVKASKQEAKTATEKSDQSFSLDEMIKSVPQWAWPLLIMSIIGLIITYIIFTKTTAAGRAVDAGLAGGIDIAAKGVAILTAELEDMDTQDPSYRKVKRMKDQFKDLETLLVAKSKPKRSAT